MILDLIHKILCAFGLHQWETHWRPNWQYHERGCWHLYGETAVKRCKHCPQKKVTEWIEEHRNSRP